MLLRRPRRGDLGRGRGDHASWPRSCSAPVVNTLLGKGACPETHPLSLGMLGMHGTAYANKAVIDCDLIMSIGARWDDRITGKLGEFCPDAMKIHIDIDPAEFNKIVQPGRAACVGDARLVDRGPAAAGRAAATRGEWLEQIDDWSKQYPAASTRKQGGLRGAARDRRAVRARPAARRIVTTDVGQHQMWAAQFYRTTQEPPLAVARAAPARWASASRRRSARSSRSPDKQVWAIVGDGGFQMTHVRAGHRGDPQAAGQGPDHQQPLPGHGAPVAGAVLRQPAVAASTSRATRTSSSSPGAYGVKGLRIKRAGRRRPRC